MTDDATVERARDVRWLRHMAKTRRLDADEQERAERIAAALSTTLSEPTEVMVDAGREAYEQGYRDGFVDHHVREVGEWPDDDGKSLLRGLDSTSLADGWQNHLDTFCTAMREAALLDQSGKQNEG